MLIAIAREVSRSIIHCELAHLAHKPIDVENLFALADVVSCHAHEALS